MSNWTAWEYEGYYFDNDISLYIPIDKGFPTCTLKYMAAHKQHLRKNT